ncbi:uncharacterized protein UTRI_02901 [Ustilago trichophora]|uniref:Uncharacterized protein n=1 Tax=Ustilago trichophora TaxID=86804 RepID=A0A5C3ENX1_9BASI|nr:uncharacterized protein UTRI_02901 [Ustilago trichophora]
MQSYFKDEVRISLLSSDEHLQSASSDQPGPSYLAGRNNQSSPSLSSRSSLSSTTVFDYKDDQYIHDYAFSSDRQRPHTASESSETLVGTFIANHFPTLHQKFPSVFNISSGYKSLATDELRQASRRAASRKKNICLLLLAALFLGVGGRQIHKAILRSSSSSAADAFRASLHDEDSSKDASIKVPTLPRPLHPVLPEDVLPFELHHNDTITPATPVPSPSASNRRQLDSIPAQRPLFDKQECVEAWIAHGTVCDALEGIYRKRPDLTNIDLLYTWVNGSDWRHSSAKWMHAYRPTGHWQDYVEEDLFPSSSSSSTNTREQKSAPEHRRELAKREQDAKLTSRSGAAIQSRFRDHEELRFSMRSVAKHLHGLSTIHIVAPDFSAPYHLQPGAQSGKVSTALKLWNRIALPLRRGSSQPPFMLDVDRLNEGFLGLPSQLRRVQGLGTDRFTTSEGQIREGQVPQWLSVTNSTHVLAGQEAATAGATWTTSFSESLSRLFSSSSSGLSGGEPPKVRLHHDWNAFTDNWLVTEPLTADQRKHRDDYRRAALPTFNSMAVESMLGDQPGLSDNFIYSNDDFFLMDDTSTGDVISPLFGPVLRLDYNLVVEGKRSPENQPGEWSALWHTNWLLDQRFGKRRRPYIQHVHKSFSKSLLLETRMGWAAEHARLALNRFRNNGDNLVSHFLTYYNIVERHREALLWSFFMLRLDADGDGLVSSEQELQSALSQMGLTKVKIATAIPNRTEANVTQSLRNLSRDLTVAVRLPRRKTLAQDSANAALIKTGWPVPLKSKYAFTSQDGYPLGDISSQVIYRRSAPNMSPRTSRFAPATSYVASARGEGGYFGWPDFVDDPSLYPSNEWHNRRFDRVACELNLDRCLLQPFSEKLQSGKLGWEEVFKRFAHADVACGDCLIHHLVGQSGERGLSAFLPPFDKKFEGETEEKARYTNPVPHLPLNSVWNASVLEINPEHEPESSCFSVSCILANSGFGNGTPLREFGSKLIQRYAYTLADSPMQFKQLETLHGSQRVMKQLQQSTLRLSALQLFEQEPQASEETKAEPGAWLSSQRKVDTERPAFVCINDDITDMWVEIVGKEFTQWLRSMWPQKQAWEY